MSRKHSLTVIPSVFFISDRFRALATRDEERSNLDKFLGKVKYLLKLRFARQMLWPLPARDILKNHSYGG